MLKTFHYSSKKAEKLAVLNTPELKVLKPSDTRWLARERCVRAVRLFCTYNFVAWLFDVLHTLAKLQSELSISTRHGGGYNSKTSRAEGTAND